MPARTHGQYKTNLYHVWINMRQRCNYSKHPSFENYGGRGITVCDEWNGDFVSFANWARETNYAEGLEIDRIDNNIGYTPANCKWSTHVQNNNNKRTNRLLTVFNETKSTAEWSRDPRCSVSQAVIRSRLFIGWGDSLAVTTPLVPPSDRRAGVAA